MTAPLCHGTAGGCHYALGATQPHHTDDCPTMQERVAPPAAPRCLCGRLFRTSMRMGSMNVLLCVGCDCGPSTCTCPPKGTTATPPTKRTMGQCSEECRAYMAAPERAGLRGHLAACSALYPLQRQPGDEKDALTRLTARIRAAPLDAGVDGGAWEASALDLIHEAREEHRTADAQRAREWQQERTGRTALGERVLDLEQQRDTLAADLAKAKEMVRTLTLQQSEVRQRFLLEGRSAGHDEAVQWCRERGMRQDTVSDLEDALLALSQS